MARMYAKTAAHIEPRKYKKNLSMVRVCSEIVLTHILSAAASAASLT